MAGGLARGIGLGYGSALPNLPQQSDAFDFLARDKVAGKAREAAAKAEADKYKRTRLDAIMDDMDMKFDLEPLMAKQYNERYAEAIDFMTQAYQNPDANVTIAASKKLRETMQEGQRLQEFSNNIRQAKVMQEKDPDGYNLTNYQKIGGKTYSSVIEAMSDPDLINDRSLWGELGKFNSTEVSVKYDPETGRLHTAVNPQKGEDYRKTVSQLYKTDQFNAPTGKTRKENIGTATWEYDFLGAPTEIIAKDSQAIANRPSVALYELKKDHVAYNQARIANGEDPIPIQQYAEEFGKDFKTKLLSGVTQSAMNEGKWVQRQYKPPSSGGGSTPADKLTFNSYNGDGGAYGIQATGPTAKTDASVHFDGTARYWDHTKQQWATAPKGTNVTVTGTPSGIVWIPSISSGKKATGNWYAEYTTEYNPEKAADTRAIDLPQGTKSRIYLPLTENNKAMVDFATAYNVPVDAFIEKLKGHQPTGFQEDQVVGFQRFQQGLGKPVGYQQSSGNTISINDVPLGAKVETKGGKNFYNGKEVVM